MGVLIWGTLEFGSKEPFVGGNLKDLPANTLTMKAIDMRISHTQAMFNLALISVGALWTLILGAEEKKALKVPSEWIMFASATVVLVFAIVMYWSYTTNLQNALFTGGKTNGFSPDISVPDVFQAAFEVQYYALAIFVGIGVASAALTLFSTYKLR
jgi:hypothetical protein